MARLKIVQIGIGHDRAYDIWNSINKQKEIFDIIGWCSVEDEEERPIGNDYPADKHLTFDEVLN